MVQKVFNALLFDTRSIQRYIYSGDRLSTNVGASYIVDRLFFDVLIGGVLKEMFPEDKFSTKDDAWDPVADAAQPWNDMNSCCVAYIGGGNALVLFDSSKADRRVEVVEKFTRKLLVERPGLKVGVASGKLEQIGDKLNQDDIDALYLKLKENQNRIFPAVNVPYSGLTLSCEINGETANFCRREDGEVRFYSQEAAVKAKIAVEANKNLHDRFKEIFALKKLDGLSDFDFPTEVEKLGQKDGENYFAIVHVDGNNMGLKFRQCTGLVERRKLSREIRRKTEGAFAELLAKIIRMKNAGGFDNVLDLDEKFLPIRPLIIGGDDVTFFCPAKMAILFTKTLMENLYAETPEDAPEHLTGEISRRMDACAGIAILPTKYPFFRGYELAEQLCDAAKKSMRELAQSQKNSAAENLRGSSWLDFAILHGEQAPTLEQIRSTEYRGARGNLHFGPYRVCNDAAPYKRDRLHNLENLLTCTTKFPKAMANNKIKELRGVLQRGQDDAQKFLQQLKNQDKHLPDVPDWDNFKETLWHNGATPYVDAIELTDFYSGEVADAWQKLT
ncbi:MAG: hypothetical protein II857_07480 [Selenomonadaceae bacterium]|nr:hypothetical protein [Selenomonadaceae bacterium]